jgi:hypothetical protein
VERSSRSKPYSNLTELNSVKLGASDMGVMGAAFEMGAFGKEELGLGVKREVAK